jgi:probable rRNA maturation factor
MMASSEHGPAAEAAGGDVFAVEISDAQQAVEVDHDRLRQLTRSVLQDEGIVAARISIALVDDPTIHDINRRFLQHDYPTDVISFLLSDEAVGPAAAAGGGGSDAVRDDAEAEAKGIDAEAVRIDAEAVRIEGEVVISGETAARTAAEIGCPPTHEVALYLVHGLLHLCGYDDQNEADRSRMRRREQSHLQKIGITANYED